MQKYISGWVNSLTLAEALRTFACRFFLMCFVSLITYLFGCTFHAKTPCNFLGDCPPLFVTINLSIQLHYPYQNALCFFRAAHRSVPPLTYLSNCIAHAKTSCKNFMAAHHSVSLVTYLLATLPSPKRPVSFLGLPTTMCHQQSICSATLPMQKRLVSFFGQPTTLCHQ